MHFQIRKLADEGTATPFIARLSLGALQLRDFALSEMVLPAEMDAKRLEFDTAWKPVVDALSGARDAARELNEVIRQHVARVQSGEVVTYQPSVFTVNEAVDSRIAASFSQVLDRGYTALKGMQAVTAFFGLDIGFLFQKDVAFEKGLAVLRARGKDDLAAYLERVRASWSGEFLGVRSKFTHEGEVLPSFVYSPEPGPRVRAEQPSIREVPVSEFTGRSINQMCLLAENLLAHAVSGVLPVPLALVEISPADRDPGCCVRFRQVLVDGGSGCVWKVSYDETEDFS